MSKMKTKYYDHFDKFEVEDVKTLEEEFKVEFPEALDDPYLLDKMLSLGPKSGQNSQIEQFHPRKSTYKDQNKRRISMKIIGLLQDMKADVDLPESETDTRESMLLISASNLMDENDFDNFVNDTTVMLNELEDLEEKLLEDVDFDMIEEIEEMSENEANLQ